MDCLRNSAAAAQLELLALEYCQLCHWAGQGPARVAAGSEPGPVCAPANRKRGSETRLGRPAGRWGVPGVGVRSRGTPASASRALGWGCIPTPTPTPASESYSVKQGSLQGWFALLCKGVCGNSSGESRTEKRPSDQRRGQPRLQDPPPQLRGGAGPRGRGQSAPG